MHAYGVVRDMCGITYLRVILGSVALNGSLQMGHSSAGGDSGDAAVELIVRSGKC